jgi:ABC-type branched-subunit amino acid transport system ATPase component
MSGARIDALHGSARQGSLAVEGLSVHFGGMVAVDSVTLEVPTGRATGLIGPNGAGKTTTFNACSGLVKPARGQVRWQGRDVTNASPARRARLGLGRTFQRTELCDSLSVWDNVALAPEARSAGGNPVRQLMSTPAQAAAIREATDTAMEVCGITHLRDRTAGGLSTGELRLVELARVLSARYDIVMLDEPSSGLDSAESLRFAEILGDVLRTRSVGIFLVEHDMTVIRSVCQYVYVLDFGKLICQGPTAEALDSDIVKKAYLGGSFTAS